MGNNSPKSNKRKHIYEELNKTIDSFNSNDNYPLTDDEIWSKKKTPSKLKLKKGYKIKKRKKIETELNNELIESSILISDFITNNLINKKTNRRALPDTNMVNSLLVMDDLFWMEDGIKMNKQMDYCEQIINNGINDCKKEFKGFSENDSLSFEEKNKNNSSNQVMNNKIEFITDNFNKYEKMNINKSKNDNLKGKSNDFYKNNKFKINKKIENDDSDESNTEDNNKYKNKDNNYNNKNLSFGSYLYKPKQIKTYINKNKFKNNFTENKIQSKENQKLFEKNPNNNIINNKNKILIGNNKGKYIKKKIFIPLSPRNNRDKGNRINFTNIENNIKDINDFNNKEIYNDNYKNNNTNIQNKREKSYDNIKKNYYNKITNKEIRRRIDDDDDFQLSNTQNIINKKDYFNDINQIEKSYNFKIANKDNNINNFKPYKASKNKIEKSTYFNIIDDVKQKYKSKESLPNIKNNIELESEYRKSKIFLNEELNNNEKLIKNLNNSSLKEFVNKKAKEIRQSPDYIKNKEKERKKEKSKNTEVNNINKNNYYFNNNTSPINGGDYIQYSSTNYTNKNKYKEDIKPKKPNTKRNHNNKNTKKKNVITIDLRHALSSDKYKKK